MVFFDMRRWAWRPLQHILQAYLDIIEEGKISTYSDRRKEKLDDMFGVFPWEIHQHTPMDIERAVSAFTRLLDAIETRLPSSSSHEQGLEKPSFEEIALPYSESVIDASFTKLDSFTGSFLSALPGRQLRFRYIAPGIRLQNSDEFINQPFAERRNNHPFPELLRAGRATSCFPLLLFRGDQENKSPWSRPWFPDGNASNIPTGFYIEPVHETYNWSSGNKTRLLLPFNIGSNGFARSSNGVPFIPYSWPDQLYHSDLFSGYSGYLPWDSRSSYLHKVLENWAERVEMGDWLVGKDGVVGGIEKFKEADTEGHWREYVIPW